MKIQHRVPAQAFSANMTGRLDPDYAAEVEQHTARGEREYAQAQRRLEAAEHRAERAEREANEARSPKERRLTRKQLHVAWALVQFRREELQNLAAVMQSVPASAAHRGHQSFRPVPVRHGADF